MDSFRHGKVDAFRSLEGAAFALHCIPTVAVVLAHVELALLEKTAVAAKLATHVSYRPSTHRSNLRPRRIPTFFQKLILSQCIRLPDPSRYHRIPQP